MKNILVLLLLGWSLTVFPQHNGPNISFDEVTYNFGNIREDEAPVTHKFEFTNTGASPLIIQDVKASCGCTTPKWTKEPIKPGEKGYISATYNPKNRPGNFTKSITVTSNSLEPVTRLTISGNVEGHEKTIEEIYRFDMSGVRFNTNNLGFGKVYKDQTATKEIECVNSLDQPVTVTFANIPAYLTIDCEPATFQPQGEGLIKFTYDGGKNTAWGHSYIRLNVLINGQPDAKNQVTISATIEEDFSILTPEEIAKSAHIEFKTETHDFGTVTQGASVEYLYEFTNTGQSNLIIRQVKASCGCTAVKPEKSVLKPGESSTIKAIFNSRGRNGSQNKSITVITNDPVKPTRILYLKGEVVVPAATQ